MVEIMEFSKVSHTPIAASPHLGLLHEGFFVEVEGAFRTGRNWADYGLSGSGGSVQLADITRGAIAMPASDPDADIGNQELQSRQCNIANSVSEIMAAKPSRFRKSVMKGTLPTIYRQSFVVSHCPSSEHLA